MGQTYLGAFWVWDARLTSMLILLMPYIGYYMIWAYKDFSIKMAAVVNHIGLVNVPIIKFSVDMWSTLHQKSSFIRSGGVAIYSSMITPLFLMLCASCVLTFVLWYFNFKSLLNCKKIDRLLLNQNFTVG